MTSPSGNYGGGYYPPSSFADTPIYDSLVAERGTPQIAPIRVPSPYDSTDSQAPALPALPSTPSPQAPQDRSHTPPHGHPAAGSRQEPPAAPYPQQTPTPRTYGQGIPQQQPHPSQMRPAAAPRPAVPRPAAPRPAAPRPAVPRPAAPRPAAPYPTTPGQTPTSYEDPYGRPHPGAGY